MFGISTRISKTVGLQFSGCVVPCVTILVREGSRSGASTGIEWLAIEDDTGSHRQFRHPHKGRVVTVPGQLGKDVPTGTLKAILRSAELDGKEVH